MRGSLLRHVSIAAVSGIVMFAAGCRYEPARSAEKAEASALVPRIGRFERVELPAAAGAGQPFVSLSGPEGALVSWLEPGVDGKHALKFARVDGATVSPARVIVARDDFFVNFADFPSIVDAGGVYFAHWLQKRGPGTYAYDVMLSSSRDGGATWSDSIVVHDDGVLAEHGFASLVPLGRPGAIGIAWLDGRNMSGEGEGHDHSGGDMTLRYAEVDASLAVTSAAELDARTCECCATAIAMTASGPLVAFRDRDAAETRDIGVTRAVSGRWETSRVVAADGWTIHGCPVNGPQADARGNAVALAWYSGAGERSAVRLAFSGDAGATFSAPIEIAGKGATGHVDCAFVADDRVVVSWIDDDGAAARVQFREVMLDGTTLPVATLASTTRGRTGFPRIAVAGDSIFVTWNEKGDSPKIHLARAPIGN